jgi:general secretion pathway protein D
MTLLKILGIGVLCMGLALPAYADRGSGAYRKGVRAERQANLDAAYGFYNQAHTLSPKNARYFMAYTRMRFKAANEHVHNGQLLRNAGALEEAWTEFQQAVGIDATNFLAHQELRLTADLMRERDEQRSAPPVESPLSKFAAEPVELQPIPTDPIAFKMARDSESIYKALCKMAGLNVLFDSDLRPQQVKLDLSKVTLLQALDMLRMQSKTFWRPVAANTIFVTTDAAKRKDLEQNFMKTFYLQNVSSAKDHTESEIVFAITPHIVRGREVTEENVRVVEVGTGSSTELRRKRSTPYEPPRHQGANTE